MSKFIDLTGQKFGRLTVIGRADKNKGGQWKWNCKCECGKPTIVIAGNLKNGHTKSCGCLRDEKGKENFTRYAESRKMEYRFASMKALIRGYESSAKRRGHIYNLTEEQFVEITQKDCFYCGEKPNNIIKRNGYNGDYIHNGIDRIDNTKGYTINNVVPCCKICNQAKHKLSLQEFKNWVEKVCNRFKNNG